MVLNDSEIYANCLKGCQVSLLSKLIAFTVAEVQSSQPISCSLIPRPFPLPVFDCLQYANAEGEGLGDLVVWLHTQVH